METTTISPDDYENIAVGHAGLYSVEPEVLDAKPISATITMGITSGKTLIDSEKGIKTFVADVLAKKYVSPKEKKDGSTTETLGQYNLTPEDVKHLPDSETGVWIYYLTQGIMRDFNLTWERTPTSLQEKKTKLQRDIIKGKRVYTKKGKNELLAKANWLYWSDKVSSGELDKDTATELMQKAIEDVEELKKEGLYLSPKKTEGLLLFDYKKEVLEANGLEDGFKLYSANSLDVVIPNLWENFFAMEKQDRKKKLCKEVDKTFYFSVNEHLNKEKMLEYDWGKTNESKKEVLNQCIVKGIHIVKIKKSGMMKQRYVCLDCVNKKTKQQVLHLFGNDVHITMSDRGIEDDAK